MAIPDFQSIMRPLLELSTDGKEHSVRELIEPLSVRFHLSEEDRNVLHSSGRQAIFYNRAAWAKTYLKQAGLLEPVRRGVFRISPRGQEALLRAPEKINVEYLLQFKEFADFRQRKREETDRSNDLGEVNNLLTPEESVETAFKKFRKELEAEDVLVNQ